MKTRIRSAAICFLCLAIVATITGCGTYARSARSITPPRTRLTFQLPENWLHYTVNRKDYVLTRDGLRLERIVIGSRRYGEKLANTERRLQPGMLPFEAAELSLGLLAANENAKNFKTDAVSPATMGGLDGYRADASWIDEHGLPIRMRLHGVMLADSLCEVAYIAERSTYFDKYVSVAEQVVNSAVATSR